MFPRLRAALGGARRQNLRRPPAAARRVATVLTGALLTMLWLVPAPAMARTPSAGERAEAQAQVLTWTADDSITSYASAPETATAGTATIVFENSAATGNTTGVAHTLTFDTTTPGYNHDVDLDITASPYDANGGRHEVQVTLTPGKYRYYCAMPGHGQMTGVLIVTDGGGGDTTAPEVSAEVAGDQNADGAYIGSATVTLSAQDSGSGLDSIEYEIDDTGFTTYSGPVTVDEPGDHSVQYRATDSAGNVSQVGSVSFTVVESAPEDTTAPEVSASVTGDQDSDGSYVGSATVTLSAQDSESGLATTEYALDGQPFTTYSGPVTVNEPGEHTLRYRATDQAGNTSTPESVSFTVVEPAPEDTTAPQASAEISGDQNADGAYIDSATVTLSAQDSGSGLDSIEYSLNGQPFTTYSGPVTVDQPGEHTLRYRATDQAGNTSDPKTVSFSVVESAPEDTTAPEASASVTGDQNSDGNYLGTATVTLSARDSESGVYSIEYAVDGADFTTYSAPVTVNEPGDHTLRYRATDQAGNTSTPESVSFTVVEPAPEDTTAPEASASVTGDQNSDGAYIGSATVTLSAQDSGSGVDSIEYSLDGAAYAVYTKPLAVNQPGAHTVTFRATDQAGNTSTPESVSFTVTEADPGDSCPNSDTRATVVIDGRDTGVENATTANGCTINDLIAEDATYRNHGAFVSHVAHVTDRLVTHGVLTRQEKKAIMHAAGRSDIGK